VTLTFRRRRSRERQAALAGDFPETGETIPEILARVRPASYDGTAITAAEPKWTGSVYVFEGASDVGLPAGAVYGPPPVPAVTA
jgi:hypothetical protein